MRKQSRIASLRPRSGIAVPCPFLHLNLHANGGSNTTVAYERRLPSESAVSTGTFDYAGGAAAEWSTAGWLDPQGGADDGVLFTGTDYDELFKVDATTHQIIILAHVNIDTAVGGSNEFILQWGARQKANPGGIGLSLTTGAQLSMGYYASATTDNGVAQKSLGGTGEFTFCGVIDVDNDEVFSARDGDFEGAAVASNANAISTGIAAGTNPTDTGGNYGLSLFGGHNAGVDTLQANLNSGTGAVQIADLWVLRTVADDSAWISQLFEEYHDRPREQRLRTFLMMSQG